MRKTFSVILLSFISILGCTQDFVSIDIDSEVTSVLPMTGIVFWPGNSNINTDAISLEYSYMDFSKIVTAQGVYDWTVVDGLLDEMAARNHQAVFRFRYTYPGETTTVPQYIKDLPDYNETEGTSEGQTTWFPDWTHEELKRFTLEFYQKYAARYDKDPRLAFVQVGFGLWAEYHIYDGPFQLGVTFPDKAFQKVFFNNLDSVFNDTFWSISIDAADDTYSPFEAEPELKNINFGLFDDSFMHQGHAGYNTSSWNFFDRNRYKIAPAGGEFSYYTDYDQQNVLNPDEGPYGVPYEIFAQDFHITYMIGNDQPGYQTMDRIKEASMRSGYKFKIVSIKTKADSSIVEVANLGVAPIYIDAYIAINGIRSPESLKLLTPTETRTFHISAGGSSPVLTIESDDILDTQTIEFFGTVNDYEPYVQPEDPVLGVEPDNLSDLFSVYPTVSDSGIININYKGGEKYKIKLYNQKGSLVLDRSEKSHAFINSSTFARGAYLLVLSGPNDNVYTLKLIFN